MENGTFSGKKTVQFEGYKLLIDLPKTFSYYQNLPFIGEEEHCSCMYCRNYVEAILSFPESVQVLFHELGADLRKDAYVSHFFEDNKHYYISSYKVFGKILSKPELELIEIGNPNLEGYFKVGIQTIESSGNSEIDLYIEVELPWLLENETN